jgi:glycosyltransferase involved in cell wall biosynthesis
MRTSVVIPAHNEERYIGENVLALLNQTKKPYEIIVVNDGSKDRTESIVEGLRRRNPCVKLLNYSKGHSAAFARNRGAASATGDILLFIDADIIVRDNKLISKIEDEMQNRDALSLVVKTEYKTLMQKAQGVRPRLTEFFLKLTGKKINYFNVIRRKVFKELRGFNENIYYYEDRELGERIAKRTKIDTMIVDIYHEEPDTLKEIIQQARSVGKGISTYNLVLEDPKVLLYPHYPFFWVLFLLSILLWFFSPYLLEFLLLVLAAEFLLAIYLTHEILPSLLYVFIISPIRSFAIAYSYIKNKTRA